MEELVRFENLSKWNRNKEQFTDITFSLNAGEFSGIISDNLRVQYLLCEILRGNILPSDGAVFVQEKRMTKEDAQNSLRKIVYLMDGREHYSSGISVMDLFLMSTWSENSAIIRKKRMEEKIAEACGRYGIILPDLHMRAEDLSVLQMCQAVLLRETLCGTRIFILMDVSEFLNRNDIDSFFDTVREFQSRGAAFLMLDHDRNLMLANVQKFILIRNGVTEYIAHGTDDAFVRSILGEYETEEDGKYEDREAGQAVLDVRELRSGDSVIRPFQIGQGEIAGLIDRSSYNGDILLKALSGEIPGSIFLNGKPFRPKNLYDAIHQGVGFVLETPSLEDNMLNGEMTVSDNLLLTIAEKPVHMSLSRYRRVIRRRCAEFFEGRDLSGKKADDLDLLDRQRLIYFRWLLYNPCLLVCYHPFSGSNLYMRRTTAEMIRMCARHGIAVLIISNRASEVYTICSRTILL